MAKRKNENNSPSSQKKAKLGNIFDVASEAIKNGDMPAIRDLLENRSIQEVKLLLSTKNADGDSALHIAIMQEHSEITKLLIDAAVKLNSEELLFAQGAFENTGCIKASNATDLMFYLIIVLCSIFNRS